MKCKCVCVCYGKSTNSSETDYVLPTSVVKSQNFGYLPINFGKTKDTLHSLFKFRLIFVGSSNFFKRDLVNLRINN